MTIFVVIWFLIMTVPIILVPRIARYLARLYIQEEQEQYDKYWEGVTKAKEEFYEAERKGVDKETLDKLHKKWEEESEKLSWEGFQRFKRTGRG